MNNKRASIIVSIYNGEKFIGQFIENILEQKCLNDVEFLLLDAMSSDKTKEIISGYNHKSIKYKLLDKKYSIYDTWNIGIDLAQADIIGNWNIDDRRNDIGLDNQISVLEKNKELDICYGSVAWSYKENETFSQNSLSDIYPCLEVNINSMLTNNSPHCMPMWRKEIHKDVGYFNGEKYPTAADFDFWMRCLFNGKRFYKLNEIVGSYYYNPNGLSTSSDTSNEKEAIDIKKNYLNIFNRIYS